MRLLRSNGNTMSTAESAVNGSAVETAQRTSPARDDATENSLGNSLTVSGPGKGPASEPTTEPGKERCRGKRKVVDQPSARSETENAGDPQCMSRAGNCDERIDGAERECANMELDGWSRSTCVSRRRRLWILSVSATLDFGNQMTELIVIEAVKE